MPGSFLTTTPAKLARHCHEQQYPPTATPSRDDRYRRAWTGYSFSSSAYPQFSLFVSIDNSHF